MLSYEYTIRKRSGLFKYRLYATHNRTRASLSALQRHSLVRSRPEEFSSVSQLLEQILANPAEGAFPSVGELLERCSRRDTVSRISIGRVIDIITDGASPFLHCFPSYYLMRPQIQAAYLNNVIPRSELRGITSETFSLLRFKLYDSATAGRALSDVEPYFKLMETPDTVAAVE